MNKYLGYLRVSTLKQGEKGVSLVEQRDAIERHAKLNNIEIVQWFEERLTAAKGGRPVFREMLSILKKGRASGVVIHKIDRSARNLRDWADLGELIDRGIDVQFANESLDLHSRGGRLSADIQAVVASDFIRNLREETRKGFYGRLKQGLYPMRAPIGYLDRGGGQVKTLDPLRAPLVKDAFRLYASARFTLDSLAAHLAAHGLTNREGGKVTRNGLSVMLSNPFYCGIIKLSKTGETFPGAHEPLIGTDLFSRVQAVLHGRTNTRTVIHRFLFRRLFRCASCGRALTGERQKGLVYYRCHGLACRETSVREEALDAAVRKALGRLSFAERIIQSFWVAFHEVADEIERHVASNVERLRLLLCRVEERIKRLGDALLDGLFDPAAFKEKQEALLFERRSLQEQQVTLEKDPRAKLEEVREMFELGTKALLSYEMGGEEEKREIVEMLSSNREVDGKSVVVELRNGYHTLCVSPFVTAGDPSRDELRSGTNLPQEAELPDEELVALWKKVISELLGRL